MSADNLEAFIDDCSNPLIRLKLLPVRRFCMASSEELLIKAMAINQHKSGNYCVHNFGLLPEESDDDALVTKYICPFDYRCTIEIDLPVVDVDHYNQVLSSKSAIVPVN
jgi:hypothetical protein